MDFSILIPSYNRRAVLAATLTRLCNLFGGQIRQGKLEIIVFNDASTDGTAEIGEQFNGLVSMINSPINVGYTQARSKLVASAGGAYLIMLDDDSFLIDTSALELITSEFTSNPNCAILAANIADPGNPGGQRSTDEPVQIVADFIGCGHVLNAGQIQMIGYYPDYLVGYGSEEMALALQVMAQGKQILHVANLRVFHSMSEQNRDLTRRRAEQYLNELAIVLASFPLWLIPIVVSAKLISRMRYDFTHGTPQSLIYILKHLPRTMSSVRGRRHPLKASMLIRAIQLNRAFSKQIRRWQQDPRYHPWDLPEGVIDVS